MTGQEISINLPHLKLGGLRWGQGNAIKVLALHGWLDNAASFHFLAPKLAEAGMDLVALDLPGHGNSQHRPTGAHYHLVDYLKDIRLALDEIGWQRPVLLGHSLGAVISSMYAAAAGESLSRLVLIEALGPLADDPEKTGENLKKALQRAVKPSSQKRPYYTFEKAVEDRQRGFGGLSEEASRVLVARNLTEDRQGFVWKTDSRLRWPSYFRMTEPQVRNYLGAIDIPSMLAVGSNGFVSLDPEKNSRLECISLQKSCVIEGSHHCHMDGDVSRLASEIVSFVVS